MIATVAGSIQIFPGAEVSQVISEGYWEREMVGQSAGGGWGEAAWVKSLRVRHNLMNTAC